VYDLLVRLAVALRVLGQQLLVGLHPDGGAGVAPIRRQRRRLRIAHQHHVARVGELRQQRERRQLAAAVGELGREEVHVVLRHRREEHLALFPQLDHEHGVLWTDVSGTVVYMCTCVCVSYIYLQTVVDDARTALAARQVERPNFAVLHVVLRLLQDLGRHELERVALELGRRHDVVEQVEVEHAGRRPSHRLLRHEALAGLVLRRGAVRRRLLLVVLLGDDLFVPAGLALLLPIPAEEVVHVLDAEDAGAHVQERPVVARAVVVRDKVEALLLHPATERQQEVALGVELVHDALGVGHRVLEAPQHERVLLEDAHTHRLRLERDRRQDVDAVARQSSVGVAIGAILGHRLDIERHALERHHGHLGVGVELPARRHDV
jgi:hypothetical protein